MPGKPWKTLSVVLLACMGYSVIRYVGFADESPDRLPAFLSNKALAIAAVVLTLLSVIADRAGDWMRARFWGLAAGATVVLHLLLSMILIGPSNYPVLYAGDHLSLAGELLALTGALGTLGFLAVWQVQANFRRPLLVASLLAIAVHVTARGLPGWFTPGKWPGGLPPITLLSLAVLLATIVLMLRRPRRQAGSKP